MDLLLTPTKPVPARSSRMSTTQKGAAFVSLYYIQPQRSGMFYGLRRRLYDQVDAGVDRHYVDESAVRAARPHATQVHGGVGEHEPSFADDASNKLRFWGLYICHPCLRSRCEHDEHDCRRHRSSAGGRRVEDSFESADFRRRRR